MYFDTHAHYDDPAFDTDRDEVLAALRQAGVAGVVDPGCDVNSSRAAAALAERWDFVYAAAGIQPEECAGADEADFAAIDALCAHPRVVAVGEIGLDYHWPQNPPREVQQQVFRRMLAIAQARGLPVIVHDRDAHADTLAVTAEFPAVRGVFHCFSGSAEMARELVRRGWYLGFDGPVTYANARRALEAAAAVPLERILTETDSPYLAPASRRGRRNDSRALPDIVEKLAQVKGISPGEMADAALANAKKFFGLD
jgi:TatD DNase family protein